MAYPNPFFQTQNNERNLAALKYRVCVCVEGLGDSAPRWYVYSAVPHPPNQFGGSCVNLIPVFQAPSFTHTVLLSLGRSFGLTWSS